MKYFLNNHKILPLYRMLDQYFKQKKISFNYKVLMIKLNVELQVLCILIFSNDSIFVADFLLQNCKSSPLLFCDSYCEQNWPNSLLLGYKWLQAAIKWKDWALILFQMKIFKKH